MLRRAGAQVRAASAYATSISMRTRGFALFGAPRRRLLMPIVDLAFRLQGDRIPADHGYALLGAVSRIVSAVHGDDSIGIHPIIGRYIGNREIALSDRSRLVLRLDSDRIAEVLPLAGGGLDLDGRKIRVGVPETWALVPAARVRSRLVVIKGFLESEPFLEAVRRQLDALGVKGVPGLLRRQAPKALEGRSGIAADRSPFVRRTVRIRDKTVVGYAVEVMGLDAGDSIKLQEVGLGGRRRFGCGVFVPFRG
jgi:CRISPR-associated protein Cas6